MTMRSRTALMLAFMLLVTGAPCIESPVLAAEVAPASGRDTLHLLARVDTAWPAKGVRVSGNLVVLHESYNINLFDVQDPAHPVLLSRITSADMLAAGYDIGSSPTRTGSFAYYGHITLAGNHLILGSESGLLFIDISDPRNPRIVSRAPLTQFRPDLGGIVDVAVEGNYAYVAVWNRLVCLDISVITRPVVVGTAQTSSWGIWSMVVEHGRLYINQGSWIEIWDVSNPALPRFLCRVNSPGFVSSLSVHGGLLAMGTEEGSVALVDVSTPRAPRLLWQGSLSISPSAVMWWSRPWWNHIMRVDFDGDRLVAVNRNHITTLDISNPQYPRVLADIFSGDIGLPYDVRLVGSRIFVATRRLPYYAESQGLMIFDLDADVTPPTLDVSVSPTVLWPANHRMVEITAAITVRDDRDPRPRVWIESITSNEADSGRGSGKRGGDIQRTADGRVFLRAERNGNGTGRIYTITYVAADASGNSTRKAVVVSVPHDRRAAGK